MTVTKDSVITVTAVERFLTEPPTGFSVEVRDSEHGVHSDPEQSLVLIDDFHCSKGKVVFQGSRGSGVKMQNLWEYTSMRKTLLSRRIYLLVSAYEENCAQTNAKEASGARVLQQYVVSINGSDPFIKWQMEKGLDWTISSVVGESYRVDVDLAQLMESWAAKNTDIIIDGLTKVQPVWRDASFTLKYYTDALFDFPHWFGFSKRQFKLRMT
ncbi:mesenteric estrogen-dependent adipogenesis protein isoform X2 [Sparus aurata]|uniref:Mesenteric estrogen-dependent adipogenesis protein n=1 Tax=Sparus aurata TaxID=8175 RepID=A0A671YGB5_SPAAU|nr:mesenteric estrogen-dependent adipogenesis protein isoform X2 [Sparus aurata]